MKTIELRYASHDNALKRQWKVAKAIVAGCERRWTWSETGERQEVPVRATLRAGVIRLHVRQELAQSADWWMRTAAQSEWDDCAVHNLMQLVLRCKCVLYPEHGPNGGFGIRNGAPTSAEPQTMKGQQPQRVKVY